MSDLLLREDHVRIAEICRVLCEKLHVQLEAAIIGEQEPKTLIYPVVLQHNAPSGNRRPLVVCLRGSWVWDQQDGIPYWIRSTPKGTTLEEIINEE